MKEWAESEESVKEFVIENSIHVISSEIKINDKKTSYETVSSLDFYKCPKTTNLIFTQEDKTVEIHKGEIALPASLNGKIEIGDKIIITLGDYSKTFKVKCFVKDAVFGSSTMSYSRTFISDEDFEEMDQSKEVSDTRRTSFYSAYAKTGYTGTDILLVKSIKKLEL